MKCEEHSVDLGKRRTKYGYRYSCPVQGCTVVSWGLDNTTPADDDTRKGRMAAHAALDPLWKKKIIKRGKLYKQLAEHMGLEQKDTHIGLFDIEQCGKVVQFIEGINP